MQINNAIICHSTEMKSDYMLEWPTNLQTKYDQKVRKSRKVVLIPTDPYFKGKLGLNRKTQDSGQ